MNETEERVQQFLQNLAGDVPSEQLPELMLGVMRAFKNDVQRMESENDDSVRYSERTALMALCGCCVETQEKGVHTSQLGEAMGLAPSTVTPLLDALEQKGFLTRHRLDSDRRVVVVSPTELGWKMAAQYQKKNVQRFTKLLCWLGEEDAAELLRLLKRISVYYEKEGH